MRQAHCSWCYHQTHHTLEEKNRLRRNRYRCTWCDNTTYECRFCQHMARGGQSWDDELCAEHAGEVPDFKKINRQLSQLNEAHLLFNRQHLPASIASVVIQSRLTRLFSGNVDDFKVELHQPSRNTRRQGVVFINGFLSQDHTDNQDWAQHLDSTGYNTDAWYRVHWESCQRSEIITSVAENSVAGPPLHWYTALLKAEITGRMLGIALSRTPGWTFTLIGHSLGARVIHSALITLAHITGGSTQVDRAILLGGAVDCTHDSQWDIALKSVKSHIDNGFSQKDDVLNFLYQSSLVGRSRPAGLHKINSHHRKIRNFDCTDLIDGHTQWKPHLGAVLSRMNRQPPNYFKAKL